MSLQRKINKTWRFDGKASSHPKSSRHASRPMTGFIAAHGKGLVVHGRAEPLKDDKGKENGSCNRTACQRPLAGEIEHQFMDGNFTGGPRLFYCADCAYEFDKWDYRSGDRIRIQRELKAEWV